MAFYSFGPGVYVSMSLIQFWHPLGAVCHERKQNAQTFYLLTLSSYYTLRSFKRYLGISKNSMYCHLKSYSCTRILPESRNLWQYPSRGCLIIIWTGLNIKIDIAQKVYELWNCSFAKMNIPSGENFGKRTVSYLIYFLSYAYFDI